MPNAVCRSCGQPVQDTGGAAVCPRCVLADAALGSDPTIVRTPPAGPAQNDPTIVLTPPSRPAAASPALRPSTPPEVASAPEGARYGSYICMQRLGAGAMGEVFKAWDASMGRWVALKFLKGGDDQELERFRREASLAGKLAHPNIAAVYAVGEERGRHFIAMQYIEGRTLRALGRRDPRTSAALIRDAAQAMAYAHAQGMIHRDLKPDNLMATERGSSRTANTGGEGAGLHVYVMDFGLARAAGSSVHLTISGQILGTPSYMAPEQARGETADARSDIYALGATLYDLLTGRPPFTGSTVAEVLRKVDRDDPVAPRRLEPRVDADLSLIVMKCLEKDPARRYPAAADLAADLDRWLRGEAVTARPPSLAYQARKWGKRHPVIVSVLGVAAMLSAGFLGGPALKARWDRTARVRECRRLLAEGEAAAGRGDWAGAAAAAGRILDLRARAGAGEDLPAAQAHLLAARAAGGRGDEGQARTSSVAAFRAAAGAAAPEERRAGAAALEILGSRAEAAGETDFAASYWRVLLARFPDSPLASPARARLAAALETQRRHGEALDAWRAVLAAGALDGGDRGRAEASVRRLEALAPGATVVLPDGRFGHADLDRDGREELILVGNDARVRTYAWLPAGPRLLAESAPIPGSEGRGGLSFAADLDGDRFPELVTAWGHGEAGLGELIVWRQVEGRLEPRARAATHAAVSAFAAADLDADGRTELVVAVGYYNRRLQVRHLEGDSLELLTDAVVSDRRLEALGGEVPGREFPNEPAPVAGADPRAAGGADILSLLAGDFVPDPGLELLAAVGPWNTWRLWLLRWNPETRKFACLRRSAKRVKALGLFPTRSHGLLFGNLRSDAEARPMVEKLGVAPGDILPTGIFALRDPAALDPLDPLLTVPDEASITAFHSARLAGREDLILTRRRRPELPQEIVIHPLGPSSAPPLSLAAGDTFVGATADLDGDGDDEVLLCDGRTSGAVCRLLGLAGTTPEPPAASVATADAVGDDLVSFGLLDEALEDFRARGDAYGVARVAELRGDLRAAADLYRGVTGARRPDALRAAAGCLESLRDWRAAADATRDLLLGERLGAPARALAEDRLAWLDQAASIADRTRLPSLLDAPLLRAENPLHASLDPEGLVVRTTVGERFALGAPFQFEGGSLRVSFEICFLQTHFDSGAVFGVWSPAAHLAFAMHIGGGNDSPSVDTVLLCGGTAAHALPQNAFRPHPGSWVPVELELVEGAGRAWMRIETDPPLTMEVRLVRPLPPGEYRLGALPRHAGVPPNPNATLYRVRNLALAGPDPTLRFSETLASTARDALEEGNGEFVRKRWPEALARYDRADGLAAAEDGAFRAEVAFFRALALGRMGRREEAVAEARRGRTQDEEAFERVRAFSDAGMEEGDREVVGK